jgi:hypothetical protein
VARGKAVNTDRLMVAMLTGTNRTRRDDPILKSTAARLILFIVSFGCLAQFWLWSFVHSDLHDTSKASWEVAGSISDTVASTSLQALRHRLVPSVWTQAARNSDPAVAALVAAELNEAQKSKAMELCGKFLYSSLKRAVQVGDMGKQTFVATGDIDDMWTRDSAVQIGIYVGRMAHEPWLRLIVEGAIRRQAFNIIQDPYANAYEHTWKNPADLPLKELVIGRGGWVASRTYELDSGAYFFQQIYDYYVADDLYRPETLLDYDF